MKPFFICQIYSKSGEQCVLQTESMIGMIIRKEKYGDNLYFLSYSMFDNVTQFVKQQKRDSIYV